MKLFAISGLIVILFSDCAVLAQLSQKDCDDVAEINVQKLHAIANKPILRTSTKSEQAPVLPAKTDFTLSLLDSFMRRALKNIQDDSCVKRLPVESHFILTKYNELMKSRGGYVVLLEFSGTTERGIMRTGSDLDELCFLANIADQSNNKIAFRFEEKLGESPAVAVRIIDLEQAQSESVSTPLKLLRFELRSTHSNLVEWKLIP